MKKVIVLLCCVVAVYAKKADIHKALSSNKQTHSISKHAALEDEIGATIYTPEESNIILTKKDFERPSINGAMQSKEEIVLNHIMAYVARVIYKMDASDDVIEKYIQNIIEQNGLTRPQIIQMFKQAGYSYEDGVEQLKMMYLIENLLSYKIKSRLVVTEDDIKKYYNDHPEHVPAAYQIQMGFIPKVRLSKEQIAQWDTYKNTISGIEWSAEPYWLEDSEIGDHSAFIKTLNIHDVSDLEAVEGGYEVIKLVEKRMQVLKPLEERYKAIADELRAPMFDKMFNDYKKQLVAEFQVVYFK